MSERDENKPALSDLPPDLLKALVDFRAENGRSWKRTLLAGWLRAAFPGELQRLRNDFGPEWLTRIKESEFERASHDAARNRQMTQLERDDTARAAPSRLRM